MEICAFFGTFNPIHNGHIKMADFTLKKYHFDKIIFVPAYLPPHKELENNLAGHRLNMVKLATKSNPRFEVSDIEYQSNTKSYSIFTIEKLIKEYNIQGRINFIIGTDAFEKIETWYNADKLKDLVHFIVFPRRGENTNKLETLKQNGWSFEIAQSEYFDISSTEIRETSSHTKTNTEVEEYIKTHDLYKS
ncbi:MAG: nicotinate (nicotinamide) nucleotide adenylyltransferase [bacterium]|nr:nicotinate (nicotinamide) nucleotide adenylyltransferase [bacterium]